MNVASVPCDHRHPGIVSECFGRTRGKCWPSAFVQARSNRLLERISSGDPLSEQLSWHQRPRFVNVESKAECLRTNHSLTSFTVDGPSLGDPGEDLDLEI